MKRIFTLLSVAVLLLPAAGCGSKSSGKLLPNISGKAGEVVVVLGKTEWKGELGTQVRDLLTADMPYLPQSEPLYTLVNVPPTSFSNMFKVHRNILDFHIASDVTEPGLVILNDRWARSQCVLRINAPDAATASAIFREKGEFILSAIEQAERDRVISNARHYEEGSLFVSVVEVFGGSPHFPSGYSLKKKTDDFIWISDEKQNTIQGVLIYRYPAAGEDFSEASIIARRNEVMRENVPGKFDNTYMTTADGFVTPGIRHLRYKGRHFTETRGLWEVENDYMGGPFVSHSFYTPDGKDILVVEAFVYAPQKDKRQLLRQVESLLYSFEWRESKKQN